MTQPSHWRLGAWVGLLWALLLGGPASGAEPDARTVDREHLTRIYQALQAFRQDHGDWPRWLSELHPRYLTNATVLLSPLEKPDAPADLYGNEDPRLRTSYLYEFNPNPAPESINEGREPRLSNRDWRKLQMETYGAAVPLVRCLLHSPSLNLAVSGDVYETGLFWETDPNTAALMRRLPPPQRSAATGQTRLAVRVAAERAGGNPLSEARITALWANAAGRQPPQTGRSDTNGECALVLPATAVSELTLQVVKEGYLSAVLSLSGTNLAAEALARLEVALATGAAMGGWVRDEQGRPVARAQLHARRRSSRAAEEAPLPEAVRQWKAACVTDDEGRWFLPAVPLTPPGPQFTVEHPDFFAATAVLEQEGAEGPAGWQALSREDLLSSNAIVVLKRPFVVKGTVADAASGEPIAGFRIVPGSLQPANAVKWNYGTRYQGRAGSFKFSLDGPNRGPIQMDYARVEAEGYEPQVLRIPPADGGPVPPLRVTLQKAKRLTHVVVFPDGQPAGGAQVALVPEGQTPSLNAGGFKAAATAPVTLLNTRADGGFDWPASTDLRQLLIAHEQGFAAVSPQAPSPDRRIVLAPWAQLRGTLRTPAGAAAAGWVAVLTYELYLPSLFPAAVYDPVLTLDTAVYLAEADADGSFGFARVPPGARFLWHSLPLEGDPADAATTCYIGRRVTLAKGETLRADVAGTGGFLKGTLEWDLNDTSNSQARLGRITLQPRAGVPGAALERYVVFTRDGQFGIDEIAPGEYELTIQIFDPPFLKQSFAGVVTVPQAGNNAGSKGFPIRQLKELQPGDALPDVELSDLEGKPFRLSQARGKPMVVSLLGSWANPGFQWLAALKEAERGAAGRLTFVHLLLETDLDEARHARVRFGLAGLHAWIGPWYETSLPGELGVTTLPGVLLLDADGRLKSRVDTFDGLREAIQAEFPER